MPLVKVDVTEGNNIAFLLKMRDLIMDSVVEVLKLPADDRNIRILEYKKELFQMKSPYEIIIEISMFSGRTKEAKKLLFKLIVDRLFNELGITREKIFILLNEQPMENWGVRGGIPANEVNLGFKVNV